jgi:ADP-ribose pyrophosphatase
MDENIEQESIKQTGDWKHISSEYLLKEKWFNFRRDRVQKGNGQEMFPYYIWEFSNWAAVFPITTDGKVILVKQYRYAAGQWSIELPGGIMDPHETDPTVAAKRELLEETGYSCGNITQVTAFSPNPSNQNNFMYGFVATGCTLTHAQKFDENEEIQVIVSSVEEVKTMLREQKILQSLHITCILYALEFLGEVKW